MELANTEQREQALAARRAAEVTSLLQVSGLVSSFSTSSRQRLAWLRTHAVGQQIAAVNAETRRARELRRDARIEAVSARGADRRADDSRAPRLDGLDAVTRRALTATPEGANAALRRQTVAATAAADAGKRSNRVTVAVLFGALARRSRLWAVGRGGRVRRRWITRPPRS